MIDLDQLNFLIREKFFPGIAENCRDHASAGERRHESRQKSIPEIR
jgi:hypothetical protein